MEVCDQRIEAVTKQIANNQKPATPVLDEQTTPKPKLIIVLNLKKNTSPAVGKSSDSTAVTDKTSGVAGTRQKRLGTSTIQQSQSAKKQKLIDDAKATFESESAIGRILWDKIAANKQKISKLKDQAQKLEDKIAEAEAQDDKDCEDYGRVIRTAQTAWEIIRPDHGA